MSVEFLVAAVDADFCLCGFAADMTKKMHKIHAAVAILSNKPNQKKKTESNLLKNEWESEKKIEILFC